LLLLCARTAADARVDDRIRELLRGTIDWDRFITTAHDHRVLPLVYRTLTRMADVVPEAAMSRLRAASHANVRRNLILCSELLQIVELLRENGIRSIPYKGPIVASLVYGDISLRQFADLDIIVPVADVVKARALLVARGYRPERPMSDEQLVPYLAVQKDITLLHDERGLNVEIHWEITRDDDPIRIGADRLWQQLAAYTIAGRSIHTFTPDDLLLILCIHGAKHRWARLVWLCDISELVRTPGAIDWNAAVESARRLGSRRILLLGLALANALLGAPVPASVTGMIADDPAVAPIAEQVKSWLLTNVPVDLDLGERERYFMRLREHPRDRLRVALVQARSYLLLTTRDTDTLPVPRYLGWTLYVRRPARLAWEYGFTPFTRFLRGIFQW
jgi:hypothetical protein